MTVGVYADNLDLYRTYKGDCFHETQISPLAFVALMMFCALALCPHRISGQEGARQRAQSKQPAASPPPQFICEKTYINFAFGRAHRGIYVDREGNVYSYAYRREDKAWRGNGEGTYTEAELLEKYSHNKKLIAKVKLKELAAKRGLILKASAGAYSERTRRGADQGTYTSACFLYDAVAGKYKEITLRRTGDER